MIIHLKLFSFGLMSNEICINVNNISQNFLAFIIFTFFSVEKTTKIAHEKRGLASCGLFDLLK